MTELQQPSPGFAAPYAASPEGFSSQLSSVEDNALIWLIVGAAGFWFGFGWLTGPLGWYFGAQARAKFRALGREPSNKANGAWIIGIVTTVISYAAIALVMVVMFVFGVAAFSQI